MSIKVTSVKGINNANRRTFRQTPEKIKRKYTGQEKKTTRSKEQKNTKIILISFNLQSYISLALQRLRTHINNDINLSKHFSIDLLDLGINFNVDETASYIKQFDIVGFSAYIWNIQPITDVLHATNHTDFKHILFGGPGALSIPIPQSNPQFVTFTGNGESSFETFLNDYLSNCVKCEYQGLDSFQYSHSVYSSSFFRNYY